MKLRPLSAAVLLVLSSLTITVQAQDVRRPYIVQLADKPIAGYTGEIAGMPATQPTAGNRLNLETQNVVLYNNYLTRKQAAVRAVVASAPVLHEYSVVLNGFSAMLTDAEVRTLMARTDVVTVSPDVPRELATTYTPTFLGLDQPGGLWSQLGGQGAAGENIIIGIVDGGIWPEHPSYADRVDANGKPTFATSGTIVYDAPPSRWKGTCQTGEGFTAADCNNKLIGAQYFDASYRSSNRVSHWTEFNSSPRDSIGGTTGEGGHGTHTSTTAGGNARSTAVVGGVAIGEMSGMAPRARIASYKVCWTYLDPAQASGRRNACFTGDSVAAIEKAVVDGVHVINFSISGGESIIDPVEQAFFNASNAGVFVAASAGNSGPANTVAHISPWQATVAASTHNRELQATVTLGNGRSFRGASMNSTAVGPAPMITAEAAALPGANPTLVAQCYSASGNGGQAVLDPAKVAGKIVTCMRGGNARVDKSLAVQDAGGVGMVQIDNGTGLVAEVHAVPSVHVNAADGAVIKSYATTSGATASISTFVIGTSNVPAPTMASFSSRGPNRYDPNVLKPDMTAPGVDVIAGVSPNMTEAQRAALLTGTLEPVPLAWASYQGTSMSSPHVAGLAALLRQQHPTWSPAMIKSALMTTATDTFADAIQSGDTRGRLPFGQGAGHVAPNAAANPGLVYDITELDYRKYMCGAGVAAQCSGGSIAGYNLNLPSIAVGNVLGTVTVTRSVTNVSDSESTYTPTVAITGFTAAVSPTSLTVPAGETRQYTVTLTRTNAAENVWQFGSLTWSDGTHRVRSPIVARSGRLISAPALVESDRASGGKSLTISTGFAGKMGVAAGGMKEIDRIAGTVGTANPAIFSTRETMRQACLASAPGVFVSKVVVPSNAMAAKFELFDRDMTGEGANDLDLLVLNGANADVGYSGNGTSDEVVTLTSPSAGTYTVCALGYDTVNGGVIGFGLHAGVVTTADRAYNFKALVPAQVYVGGTATVTTSWSGLPTGKRFLGAIRLLEPSGAIASTTLLQVETNSPIPRAVSGARKKDLGL